MTFMIDKITHIFSYMHFKVRVFLVVSSICISTFLFLLLALSEDVRFPLPPPTPTPKYVPDVIPYVVENAGVCEGDEEVTALLLVTSHAGNVAWRETLRRVYPTQELRTLGVRRVFLLGVPRAGTTERDYNLVTQLEILAEHDKYSDLVQGNFTELYPLLPVKQVMGLRWAVTRCKNARFIVKIDDDVMVDIYRFLNALKSSNLEDAPRILGYRFFGGIPARNRDSKYYVTKKEYSLNYYPKYVGGHLYATTPSTAAAMLNCTSTTPYFKFEDVYITGLLAGAVGVEHIPICWETYGLSATLALCILPDVFKKHECQVLFCFVPHRRINQIMMIKEHFEYCHTHLCPPKNYLQMCSQT